jgi:predicted O-methyltransferase YrrM
VTAAILSVLYPNATILTIDLPQDEVSFATTYGRGDSVSSFVQRRNENLGRSDKIRFQEMNSVALALLNDDFDLIWVDGAHGYPVVAMDVINSVRLLKPSGFLLIDDVWTERARSDSIYRSIAAYESLKAVRDAKLIHEFALIPKRLGSVFNMPGEKKYVGVVQKRNVRHV